MEKIKHKSGWVCIVDADENTLNLVIVKKGEDILRLTDTAVPGCLRPKRPGQIHKLLNLSREDDVCQYVVRKPLEKVRNPGPKGLRFGVLVLCTFVFL